jgi:hypothetical protein
MMLAAGERLDLPCSRAPDAGGALALRGYGVPLSSPPGTSGTAHSARAPTYGVRTLCGYRSVVYVFICYVRFAEASRQVVKAGSKAGSKIIEVVWARNIIVPPCRDRGHHNFHPP